VTAGVLPGDDELDGLPIRVDSTGQASLDLERPPAEDGGAGTSANYFYQTEVIASFCVSMPVDLSITKVICEWHEDFIIVRNQHPLLELVSVKHHHRATYTTLKQLCDEGGLAHLFDRWLGFTTEPAARLCSNTRLGGRPSDPTPRALLEVSRARALATSHGRSLLAHLAWAILDVARGSENFDHIPVPTTRPPAKRHRHDSVGLPAGLFDAVLRFMSSMRFDCDRPSKEHIEDVNVRRIAEPAMVSLGYAETAGASAYQAVTQLVAEASRDMSDRPRDLARFLTDPDADSASAMLTEKLQQRTLPREMVLSAMRMGAIRTSEGGVPLLRSGSTPPRAAGGHRLVAKMTDADVDEPDQLNALRLRDLWLHFWPQVKTGFPEDVETEFRLELEILEVVREVHHQLIDTPDPYGVRFQALLHQSLRKADLGARTSIPLDRLHILGYAYELSDLCRFTFTRPGSRR
jgi:hypothetical protein